MTSRPAQTTRDTNTNQNINQQQTGLTNQTSATNQNAANTSNVGPWGAAAPFFPGLFQTGQNALDANQSLPAPTNFIAGPTTGQRSAVDMMYGVAPQLGSVADPLTSMASRIARGEFLDPSNDPTFAGAVNSAIDPVTRQLREIILPNLVNQSITAGGAGTGPSAYGGASLGLNQERAVSDWERTAGMISADMANKSRMAGMALIPQAPGIASAADTMRLSPANVTGAAGTQEQNWVQQAINNSLQQYSTAQSAPWAGIDNMLRLLTTGGFTSGAGTSATTGGTTAAGTSTGSTVGTNTGTEHRVTTDPVPSLATQWLQGIMGGAGIASSLFGAPSGGTSAASGATSAISSAMQWLPALLSASDRRLKKNIIAVGTLYDGTTIYRYEFAGTPMIGLMADEIEAQYPDAVTDISGAKFVDYNKATQRSVEMNNADA